MPLAVENDETPDPSHISLFGSMAVMPDSEFRPDVVEKHIPQLHHSIYPADPNDVICRVSFSKNRRKPGRILAKSRTSSVRLVLIPRADTIDFWDIPTAPLILPISSVLEAMRKCSPVMCATMPNKS
jgi:hypothetical protein